MIEFQLAEHEIEVEVLDLSGLEDIGIALTRALLGVGLVIDITSVIDRSLEERYVELSIKVELVEVVLDDGDIEVGGIYINQSAHEVKIDGKPIELSFKEFELLTYFVTNQGVALSRERILNNVWNYDYFGDARTIDTHVKKLRSKLGDKGEYIKTIWGMGYKFEVS